MAMQDSAFGATYPGADPSIVVGFSAGGAGDIATRVVSSFARKTHNMAITPDFRPGAGGTIATDQVRRAAPDGSIVSLFSVSPLMVAPHLQKLPYDPLQDFTYIGSYAGISVPCFVRADSAYQTWDALLEAARAQPGLLKWATAAPRGLAHIATQAAFAQEKVKASFVPFRGGADAVTALLGGHIDMVVSSDFGPHLAAGSVRLLAETSPGPGGAKPGIASFKERGYPITIPASYGLFGPKGLPVEIVAWWNDLLAEMAKSADYAQFLGVINGYPLLQGSEEFTREVRQGFSALGTQIDALGLRL
jgi:tripartite-type tricarboxylate transporter receptor subunit TctC